MDNDFTPELNFPCEYPIKVIGQDAEDFFDFVVELVSRHAPEVMPHEFSVNRSSGGKYTSVSVTIIAESREQVSALYKEMGEHKRIKVAF